MTSKSLVWRALNRWMSMALPPPPTSHTGPEFPELRKSSSSLKAAFMLSSFIFLF
jgi:hypothetical protein